MKRILSFIHIIFIFSYAPAQLVNLEWAYNMGGSNWSSGYIDAGNSISVDPQNNLIITGIFFGTADFDPDTGVVNLTSKGKQDIFIQKVNESGQLIWVHTIGGTLHDQGTSVTTDHAGNIYVTGYFTGTVDFDPGSSIYNLTSNGNMDIFALKLDNAGNFIWAQSMGGTDYDTPAHLEVDVNGNIYLVGRFANSVDFDPGNPVLNISSNGGYDYFIQKLDSNGALIWVKTFGSSDDDHVSSLIVDDFGNVYISGGFAGTVDFDPGSSVINRTSNGDLDVFIQKLNASGNFQWVKTVGGPGEEFAHSIATDGRGHVYITGSFEDSVDFDPGATVDMQYSSGYEDAFIQKLDANGNMVWTKTMGGNQHHKGISVYADSSYVYSAGWCQGTGDYDPGMDTFNLVAQGNQFDTYIQKLDSDGDFIWAKVQGGDNYDIPSEIKIDGNGDLLLVGYFMDAVDFDPGFATTELVSNGIGDIFVQKLSQCDALIGTDRITACLEYTWKDGLTYTADNNTATVGIINEFTCDSVLTLDLTIIPVEIGVNVSGNIMIADAIGASYQWLDCSNGYQPIPGEITRSYIATQFGSYAVEITENGCKDTSACISINSVGFNDISLMDEVSIFPNPTVGLVNIDFGSLENVDLTIYSLDNRVIYQRKQIDKGQIQLELNAAPGMYLVEIQSLDMRAYSRLLVNE